MIETTSRGAVTVLHLAHGKANALDVELCQGITERFESLRASPTGAVVVVGTGSIFSAGVDLLRVLSEGPEYLRAFLPALDELFETVFFYPKPVVAAVNGHAIAGGCVLACAADRRLMRGDAGRIGVTELLVGLPFPTVALEIMRFACTPSHFQASIYEGTTFPAAEAIHRGLVDEVAVEEEELEDRAIAAAEALAAIPATTFELTKRQIRAPVRERLRGTRVDFDEEVTAVWTSTQSREAIRRYVSRTFKKSV